MAYGLRIHVETAQKLISIARMLHNVCIDNNEEILPFEADLEPIFREQVNDGGTEAAEGNIHHVRRNSRAEILQLFRTRI